MSNNNDEPIIYPADDDPEHRLNPPSDSKPEGHEPRSSSHQYDWTNYQRAEIKIAVTTYVYDANGTLLRTIKSE